MCSYATHFVESKNKSFNKLRLKGKMKAQSIRENQALSVENATYQERVNKSKTSNVVNDLQTINTTNEEITLQTSYQDQYAQNRVSKTSQPPELKYYVQNSLSSSTPSSSIKPDNQVLINVGNYPDKQTSKLSQELVKHVPQNSANFENYEYQNSPSMKQCNQTAKKRVENFHKIFVPLRDIVKSSVDDVLKTHKDTRDKNFECDIRGSHKNGTDINGDLDFVIRQQRKATSEKEDERISRKMRRRIIQAILEELEANPCLRDVESKGGKRADSFSIKDSKGISLDVDVVFEKTTHTDTVYEILRDDWLPYQQTAVRALKLLLRKPGLKKRKGVHLEMLVIHAAQSIPDSKDPCELFLRVIELVVNMKSHEDFVNSINSTLKNQKNASDLKFPSEAIQNLADTSYQIVASYEAKYILIFFGKIREISKCTLSIRTRTLNKKDYIKIVLHPPC
ncbi:hypothetical protein HK096_002889 [Nowakowskiella sp. JEL0078]|nr:hypothetical protein HK096_002889 [Nowakowskiella sp. JEL0078]